MANLFEKPVAANPVSTFSQLPLQFINQLEQQNEAKNDKAQQMISMIDDTLLGTKALSGDAGRHREIIEGYNTQLDAIVASAGGDYGSVRGELDNLKYKIRKDLSSNGELGSINAAFKGGIASREDLFKRHQDKKISYAGLQEGLSKLASHKTTQNEAGQWSSFSGYNPSNVSDVVSALQGQADEIVKKVDNDGQAYRSSKDIQKSLATYMQSNPDMDRAIMENFKLNYKGEPSQANDEFKQYRANLIKSVSNDKSYQERTSAADGGGSMVGKAWHNIKLGDGGISAYKGGSADALSGIGLMMGFKTDNGG